MVVGIVGLRAEEILVVDEDRGAGGISVAVEGIQETL